MRCPSCGFDNLIGSDTCDNCGADLAGRDVPEAATSFRSHLLGELLDELLEEMNVADPDILEASADVDEAIQVMHAKGSDCVLVVDDGRLVGIFTDRDAVLKVAGRPVVRQPIADLMTRDPVILRHDDTIAVAINKMAVGGFRHVPIVKGGVPVGVVSARDVFRHLAAGLG